MQKNWTFCSHIAIEGVLTRQNGVQLYGPRVSNFLSHRIVKSLTFRIYGKLKFQGIRNGPQNPPFCPGSIQDTFILFPTPGTMRRHTNKFWFDLTLPNIRNSIFQHVRNVTVLEMTQVSHKDHQLKTQQKTMGKCDFCKHLQIRFVLLVFVDVFNLY